MPTQIFWAATHSATSKPSNQDPPYDAPLTVGTPLDRARRFDLRDRAPGSPGDPPPPPTPWQHPRTPALVFHRVSTIERSRIALPASAAGLVLTVISRHPGFLLLGTGAQENHSHGAARTADSRGRVRLTEGEAYLLGSPDILIASTVTDTPVWALLAPSVLTDAHTHAEFAWQIGEAT